MSDPTPAEILSIEPDQPKPQGMSVGWVIFWLIGLTPLGWYFVWKKTTWSTRTKLIVTVVTVLLFIGLLIESELITTQLASQLLGVGF